MFYNIIIIIVDWPWWPFVELLQVRKTSFSLQHTSFESPYKSMGIQNLLERGQKGVNRRQNATVNEFRIISNMSINAVKLKSLPQAQGLLEKDLYILQCADWCCIWWCSCDPACTIPIFKLQFCLISLHLKSSRIYVIFFLSFFGEKDFHKKIS